MEPRITPTTQDVSEPSLLGWSVDAIELTDKDLEKVTGAYWGGHRFHHFHHGGSIALNQAAIAGGGGGVAVNQAAIAR